MENKKKAIFECLRKMAHLFNGDVTQEKLDAYTVFLEPFTVDQLSLAFKQIVKTNKFFPSMSEIIDILDPKETPIDQANEFSGKIIESISRFGRDNQKDAKAYVGEIAWEAVESFGWGNLCMIENKQITIIRAQIRDYCKGVIAKREIVKLRQLGEKRDLKQVGNILNIETNEN